MTEYDPKNIEPKWQKTWADTKLYKTEEGGEKPKCYVLDEFPYPSGEGLHVGHTRIYTASDIYARMKRMQGFNVLHPSGWDAFGLPAEQFAIKNKVHPSDAVKKNTERYKSQMNRVGLSYDWEKEINTTDPKFYKWTQWAFLKMFEKGLAFESFAPINWCPTCQTGLANEDLDGANCERCGTPVEKKPMRQWVLRITDYADRLIDDIETLSEWPDAIKEAQRNWIGRSEGAEIEFALTDIPGQSDRAHKVKVFTTRPDTLFGATYLAISPELAKKWLDVGWQASEEIKNFVEKTLKEEAVRAIDVTPEKEGIFTAIFAINPANQEKIPVWIANYVLSGYGTGAIMAVPAHDERDFEFAKKYELEIKEVVIPYFIDATPPCQPRVDKETIKRSHIVALVKSRTSGKYLLLDWKNNNWKTFITGGIEKDENEVASAKREIYEETGYKNIEFIRKLGNVHSKFFVPHKDKNYDAPSVGLYFELIDEDRDEMSVEEKAKHEIVWKEEKEVLNFLHAADEFGDQRYLYHYWERYLYGYCPHVEQGMLTNSGQFDGMESEAAKTAITEFVGGKMTSQYRLKDWVFSRQRYWGEPIPIIHCPKDGIVPVPEQELPLTLPEVSSYEPTGTGESPLADIAEWVNTTCPKCDGPATRETNTMPQWAGSSWYYLRFMDPKNSDALVGKDEEKYWAPVDVYVGGAEHVTRHLIYARFWHKFLYDIGVVSTIEPFTRRRGVGLVLGEGGVKMSKRLGNVINPDDIIDTFGADSLRVYEMFMGPFGAAIPWSTDNLVGARRFVERVWKLGSSTSKLNLDIGCPSVLETLYHQTVKKVTDDIEEFKFNTAISQLMILLNALEKEEKIPQQIFGDFLKLLAPFAPHLTEELWANRGNAASIHREVWPQYDPDKILSDTITIGIQINGKLRDTIEISRASGNEQVKEEALKRPGVVKWLDGKTPKKIIYIEGKILSIVL